VVHLPVLNEAFGTAPLSPTQWAVCVALASVVLWAGELRKLVLRARARRERAAPGPARPVRSAG